MKKIILSMVLIGIVFLMGCQIDQVECPKCGESEEKALLTTNTLGGAINKYNEEEWFYQFIVINYGNKEAKNVEVKCVIYDSNENEHNVISKNIGNIASLSTKYGEIMTKIQNVDSIDEKEEVILLCLVVACDDCEILDKRIPEFSYFFDD